MRLFSTEQISKYHPDKYADQISDAILTECLKQDQNSHVAVECMVKDKVVVLGGEITTNAVVDFVSVVRRVAAKLNYQVESIINLIGKQSQEINAAVNNHSDMGAGDQGIMFGYACSETDSYLPYGFDLANKIIKRIEDDVETNEKTILKGDAKTQVTVDLDTKEVKTVIVSVCHKPVMSITDLYKYITELLSGLVEKDKLVINPSGTWIVGGPTADCGLTGRKIVCDQYGGYCAVGGGAFSGKDPSKVDRSATYMAREIAKDIVRDYGLDECQVQIGYAIGVAHPVSLDIAAKLNGKEVNTKEIIQHTWKKYDLTPRGIIKHLDLYNKDYEKLAEGCHFR